MASSQTQPGPWSTKHRKNHLYILHDKKHMYFICTYIGLSNYTVTSVYSWRWMSGPGKDFKRSPQHGTRTSACTCCPQHSASWYYNLLLITPKWSLDLTAPLGNVQSSKLWQHAWLPLHMKPSRLPSGSECQDPRSVWSPLHVSCSLSPRCSSPEPERVASKSDLGKFATTTETWKLIRSQKSWAPWFFWNGT